MSRIGSITTQSFTLPLKGNLSWGKGSRLDRLEHVLVRIETDDGHTGVAEAPARPTIYGETVQSIVAIVKDHLAPGLIGLSIENETGIWHGLRSVKNNHAARGAVDIALCEARAKTRGSTLLANYVGAHRNLACSFILGINTVADTVKEARRVVEAGVRVFKTKTGRDLKKTWNYWARYSMSLQART